MTVAAPVRAPLDHALVGPGPAGRLVVMHRLLAVALTVRLLERPWWRAADRPDELLDPVWIVSWLDSQPGAVWLAAVQVLGLVAGSAAALRITPRVTFPLAWASLVLLAGIWGSSGKVMHNELLLITVAVPFLVTDVPTGWNPSQRDERWGWAPRTAAMLLSGVYLATGVQKLRHSGLRWVVSDNMAWVVRQGRSILGPDLNIRIGRHVVLLSVIAGLALLLELSAPALVLFRRTRILFPVLVAAMHTSIWFLLGLNYSSWILTAVAVMVPFAIRWDAIDGSAPWWRRIDLPWRLVPTRTRDESDPPGDAPADRRTWSSDP